MTIFTSILFLTTLALLTEVLRLRYRSQSQLRKLIENLPRGAVLIENGRFYLNDVGEKLTGYSREEIPDMDSWFSKIYGSRAAEIKAYYHHAIQNPEIRPLVEVKIKSGEYRQFLFDNFRDKNWEVWIFADVTEHLEELEKFRTFYQNANDGYIILDENFKVVECNPMILNFLGMKGKEDMYHLHPSNFSPELQPCGERSVDKAKRMKELAMEKGFHSFEWIHKKVSGETFPVHVSLKRVELNRKKVLFVIWHDLSEIKEKQAIANYASRMSALGEMAAGIAHELNNPLAIIKGSAYVMGLSSDTWSPESRDHLSKNLSIIDSTIYRMSKIIKGLREFSRQEKTGEPLEVVFLNDVVSETSTLCSERVKTSQVNLKINLEPDLRVKCRPVELSQVLVNLLNNAFDAVSNSREKWIEITAKNYQNYISVRVSDSGPGIPPEIKEKIMLPFFTTKGPGHGTGLGLSISKGIIERHMGTISLLKNTPNTTFEIILPMPEADSLAS